MKMREIRLAKKMTACKVAQESGVQVSMISRYENYRCLPTPKQLEKICEVLGCTIGEIYEKKEIRFVEPTIESAQEEQVERTKAKATTPDYYRFCAYLPRQLKGLSKMIFACGYKDNAEWIMECFVELAKRYNHIKAQEQQN